MKQERIIFSMRIVLIFSILISFILLPVFSQNLEDKTDQFVSAIAEAPEFREKIFLHADRKIYLTGETIWFKGYCVHQTYNLPVDLSKVMYIEVLDDRNNLILSEKVRLSGGTGHGSIYIPRSIQTGIYYLRAYTRWMTNFDPEYYFMDRIFIVNPFLPVETTKGQPGISPEYSIHFYAERNRLVPGRNNDIAFCVIDQAGKGVNLNGWVVSISTDTVSSFTTYKYGFGLISFTPRLNDQYRVITVDQDGGIKEIPLIFQVLQDSLYRPSGENKTVDRGKMLNITIQPDKAGYTTRDKVTLALKTTDSEGKPVSGNMSVSVYKSDGQVPFFHKNIYRYLYHSSELPASLMLPDDQVPFAEYDSETLQKILTVIYSSSDESARDAGNAAANDSILPENRGIIISGTVINSRDGNPAPGVRVFMAKPGKNAQLYNVKSGAGGRFFIQVFDQYGREDIIMMPEENPEKYRIITDDDFFGQYANIHPVPFRPDEQTIGYLEKLMTNLQIEDAFGEIAAGQSDSSPVEFPNIFGAPEETILLEDYIRLPAVEELFVELVKKVYIKRRRSSFRLTVVDPETAIPKIDAPLLLLDGVPVLDINPVITYLDPVDIEKIEVLSSWYVIGDKFYFSVINMITKQAGYGHFELPSYAVRKQFQFLQYPVSFDSPDHSAGNDSLLLTPDFRNLLYWNPEVITGENGIATISFYTSDDISDYRIVVQGLTEDGLAGCKEDIISITKAGQFDYLQPDILKFTYITKQQTLNSNFQWSK